MEIVEGFVRARRKFRNPAVTIGNFDGVHKGHQALIEHARNYAREKEGETVVITFNPHPVKVLCPDCNLKFITPHRTKLELLEQYGVDVVWIIPFTREFASLSAREFVEQCLVDFVGVKHLVVGYDYHFGKGREGNIILLEEMGKTHGFTVEVVPEVIVSGIVVSSTSIRKLIQEGQMKTVTTLLGRPYEIRGPVVHGRGRGARMLGFPTANVRIGDYVPPRTGVYATRVTVDGIKYMGATNLGYNPTFGDTDLSLEVHILDFDRHIYNKVIKVEFIEYIRGEKKFSGIDELADQISRDVECVRQLLS
ncbi:bifunctional riboflavin kinase/FAD synthetase [Thermodesulforhabdus norvegica]|uniref:Riboflavin biosynthesis protein n=1 Tax=Thermodesulforhabdus norvegica TaxID=39841 RepID=A0A1I4SDB4_9BACT|nr:bifunctional riboflavin kinase/FAD synthetase [Thermodesulforhabdus norvegica]SFM62455.1 riboflavin kinase / FMN adenylyltransferase [Thermodesulforhabdus norvegica]